MNRFQKLNYVIKAFKVFRLFASGPDEIVLALAETDRRLEEILWGASLASADVFELASRIIF